MMYALTLAAHSFVRWVVLFAGLAAAARATKGWLGKEPWDKRADRLSLVFVAAFDTQLLLGLLLYFVFSPFFGLLLDNGKMVMKEASLRFFAVEHTTTMLLAVAIAHVGRVRARKAPEGVARYKVLALTTIVALLIVLVTIPWPGSATHGRPLLRGL
jgi:hypothetical protein